MNDEELFSVSDGLAPTLFRAGREDFPSDEALAKTLAAVGAGAAALAISGAAAGAGVGSSALAKGGAAVVSFGSVTKWLGIGALSGAVVAGVAHEVTAPAVAPHETVMNANPAPALPVPNAVRTKPKAALAPLAEPTAEPPKPVSVPRSVSESVGEPERVPLAAEVALVDRARTMLAAGNPAGALAALSAYEAAFTEPRLLPEVLFLRMEAHLAAGNRAQAVQTAEESIRRFPRSPHAARARELIGEEGR
ncbi:MAG TPA: hypothetical protein VF103_14030 [Polyangiaceae bacterium]